jgi:hypothetical protein
MILDESDTGGIVYQGDTGPPIDFLFRNEDGATPRDLTGYHGWVTFHYVNADPHVLGRAGTVEAVNGVLRYVPRGDEFPNLGHVVFWATLSAKDTGEGVDRGYFKFSSRIYRRKVVPRP